MPYKDPTVARAYQAAYHQNAIWRARHAVRMAMRRTAKRLGYTVAQLKEIWDAPTV